MQVLANECCVMIPIKFAVTAAVFVLSAGIVAGATGEPEKMDSLSIGEVVVKGVLPLTSDDVLRFYQTAHFAGFDDLLSRVGGIDMIKRGAYALEPQLGGFSAGQITLTIDGMHLFGACTDKMDPVTSYIEPGNLREIDIKHGSGGLAGGITGGGSIDLRLQEPQTGVASFDRSLAGLAFQSNSNGWVARASTEHGGERMGWLINGVYRRSGNYHDGANREILFSQFEKFNLNTSFKWIESDHELKGDLLTDLARNVGYPALPMDVSQANAFMGSLEYRHRGKADWQLKVYANTIRHVMDDSYRDSTYYLNNASGAVTDTVTMRMDMPGQSTTYGAFADYRRPLNENNQLRLKIENYSNLALAEMTMYMHYPGKPAEKPMYMQTWPKMLRNVTGLYAELEHHLNTENTVTLAVRLDLAADWQQNDLARKQFSVFGYDLPNRLTDLGKALNIRWASRPSANWTINSRLGYAERFPTITERYGYYLYNAYDGYDYLGNPNLKPEKTLSSGLTTAFSGGPVRLKLEQNFSLVSDYILGETDTQLTQLNFYARGLRVFRNYDSAILYSANLSLVVTPLESVTLFWSTNFNYGRLHGGEPLPLMAPLKQVLALVYTARRWSVQAESMAAAAQKRVNTTYRETATPGFVLVNLKADYRIDWRESSLQLTAGISNLFDRIYAEHLDWGRINRPGRSLEAGLNLRF